MAKVERKFGVMDDWAKHGPIDAKNYSQRAEGWCAVRSKERDGVHPTVQWASQEFMEWWEYFVWLGRVPATFQRIIDNPNAGHVFTVPERQPKWFDGRFAPTAEWRPLLERWQEQPPEVRAGIVGKLWRALSGFGFKSPYVGQPSDRPKGAETADNVMNKYGISQTQWNAIPDSHPDLEERATRKRG